VRGMFFKQALLPLYTLISDQSGCDWWSLTSQVPPPPRQRKWRQRQQQQAFALVASTLVASQWQPFVDLGLTPPRPGKLSRLGDMAGLAFGNSCLRDFSGFPSCRSRVQDPFAFHKSSSTLIFIQVSLSVFAWRRQRCNRTC